MKRPPSLLVKAPVLRTCSPKHVTSKTWNFIFTGYKYRVPGDHLRLGVTIGRGGA